MDSVNAQRKWDAVDQANGVRLAESGSVAKKPLCGTGRARVLSTPLLNYGSSMLYMARLTVLKGASLCLTVQKILHSSLDARVGVNSVDGGRSCSGGGQLELGRRMRARG